MSVKKQIPYDSGIFFITITCVSWIKLFEILNAYHVVYKWFDFLKKNGHFINAYVIMPNHLHLLASFSKTNKSINKIVGDGKRFMAYELVKLIESQNLGYLLNKLNSKVRKSEKLRNKKHQIFQSSFDWKYLDNDEIINQKLNYIHDNPVNSLLVNYSNPNEYIHSSANFYNNNEIIYYEVTHIEKMNDIRFIE